MGAISELFNIVGLAKDVQKDLKSNSNDSIKATAALFQKAKSISAQASKYVMEYPVACSTSISDFDTALAITKQIEFDCARFIILASGLNPVIRSGQGDTIEAHINALVTSYESYSGFKVSISPALESFEDAGWEYMNKYYSNEVYHIYNELSDAFSTEKVNQNVDDDPDSDSRKFEGKDGYKGIITDWLSHYGRFTNDTSSIPPVQNIIGPRPDDTDPEGQKEWDKADEYYKKSFSANANVMFSTSSPRISEINGRLGKVAPTIITLNLFIQDQNGVDREIQLPLAIKASLQYVDASDVADMLASINVPGKKLLNFIKMTTGQISFFKDWIVELSSIKKDIERERTVGHTPFFRSLMNNKSRWKFKTVAAAVPFLKRFISSKTQQDLPMCTLIIDEIELRNLGFRLSDCVKDRSRFIDPILDQFMLLGFGIVDKDSDIIYFFYSGESSPVTAKISDLGSNGGQANISSDLSKALANMSKFITKR